MGRPGSRDRADRQGVPAGQQPAHRRQQVGMGVGRLSEEARGQPQGVD